MKAWAMLIPALLALPGAADGQPVTRSAGRTVRPSAATLIYTLGADTTAIESFVVRSTGIEGRILDRIPFLRVHRYALVLAADGTPARLDYAQRLPDGGLMAGEVSDVHVTFGPDSLTVVRAWPESAYVQKVFAPRPVFPFVTAGWFGLYQPMVAHLSRTGADSVTMRAFPVILNLRTVPGTFTKRAGGRVLAQWPFATAPLLLDVDGDGRVRHADGRLTTIKEIATRRPPIDFDAVLQRLADRERQRGQFGERSTRDTVDVALGGAHLRLDYGRPTKRGRQIFGGLVPFGQVWRTGADAATQFRTDRGLTIGGTPVPAGAYSLWTIPAEDGATLIINRQTDQWGTQYDAAQDFARIPMTRHRTAVVVERFLMALEADTAGGMLTLSWDTVQFRVPIRVR